MLRIIRLSIAIILVVAASAAIGQDPNLKRGFEPGKVYDLLGLDSVGLFNGNLNVRIPLGQTYTVGPHLQYQFVLTYNSKVWEFEWFEFLNDENDPRKDKRRAIPERRSNAGLGWKLTLGELLPPRPMTPVTPYQGWTYVAPDGTEHEFPGSSNATTVDYTEDASYLRLRRHQPTASDPLQWEVDSPDGLIRRFDKDGNLLTVRDRFDNWVEVNRDDPYQWIVTDGYGTTVGRTHTITLADFENDAGETYAQENFRRRPTKLTLAAFNTTTADYDFAYDETVVLKGTCGDYINDGKESYYAPLLTRVTLADGTTYEPSYQATESHPCVSGTIKRLVLPTLGAIGWKHGVYQLSNASCIPPDPQWNPNEFGWRTNHAGVVERWLEEAPETGETSGDVVERRFYSPVLVARQQQNQACGSANWTIELPPEEFRNTVTVYEYTSDPDGVLIEKTTNYFSAFPTDTAATSTFAKKGEYGLPLFRKTENGGRFLSSRVHACSGGTCSDTQFARTTYLKYAEITTYPPKNPRVEAQRTVHDSDTGCSGSACYVDTAYSDFDGVSRYKQTDVTGNMAGLSRTLRTEYTPDQSAWLLNLYTGSTVSENSVVKQRMTFTFDSAGLEKSRRILKGTTAGSGDLLSVTCRDTRGYPTKERWLGGDGRTPPADTTDLCAAALGTKEYEIVHEYPSGDGFRTWHRAKYSGTSFYVADEDFDANTGNVKTTTDTAGLETAYTYDVMSRLASISPPGSASTSLAYTAASTSAAARVTATTGATNTLEETYDYDGLGRLFREKKRMPDESWALRKTEYRGGGATKFVSEWVTLASAGDEKLVNPTVGTSFEHDQFGRTTKITAADAKTMTTTYVNGGARQIQKTRTVSTSSTSSSETSITVTETHDMHGNLVSVKERSGASSATSPVAAEMTTAYEYDASNRLVKVTMTPPTGQGSAQERSFVYDARGLLTSETHPEKDLSMTYGSYDARGHAWTTTDADVTLSYEYDDAERLIKISSGSYPLKELIFGTATDCTYCKGKLRKAIRHNYLHGTGTENNKVTETYTHGANGLPSSRDTIVERAGYEIQKFTQDFTYDQFRQLDRVDFPACILHDCSTTDGLVNVEHTRTRGLLTTVSGYGTMSYHPSGMVREVAHATTTPRSDLYAADSGMPRPSKITFSGTAGCALPNSPVITAPESVCTGTTGHQASISNSQTGVTYAWSIQNGTLGSSTGTSVSFTAGASGQVILSVTAQNGCGTASGGKAVTILRPTATVSGSTTIDAGGSAYVEVALTGTSPWSVTWSDGTVNSNITTSPLRREVSPTTTTTYQLTAADDASACTVVRSGTATITVRPPSPAWATATATNLSVSVTWPAVTVTGGARYDVERASNLNGPFLRIATAISVTSLTDTAPSASDGLPVAYVYRVLTVAPDNTRSSVQTSPRDYAVTASNMYPSGAITAGVTYIRPDFIVELRRGIDALRKLVNLSEAFGSQAPPSGLVRATDFAGLLAPLDTARAPFGHGPFVYGGGIARPEVGILIKVGHVTQLREVLR